jgi:hypothetical protein
MTRAGGSSLDEEIEDDGMDDELVFRSLLQATAIGSFFTTRYLLDVLFTPHAVNALSRQILNLLHCICRAAWTAPVASLLLLYFWGSLQPSTVVTWVLKGCILRAVLAALLDNTVVLKGWRKRHVWVPLAWWATFTRVSSGREEPRGGWSYGCNWFLYRTTPWVIRLALFFILSSSWPHSGATLRGLTTYRHALTWPHRAEPSHDLYSTPVDRLHPKPSPPAHEACTSFRGHPVDCDELRRIREFNAQVMPHMLRVGYRGIRKAMNDRGFRGHMWHVGHACPDPSKMSTRDEEDYGWNLFAQYAPDNTDLSNCLVSCSEAEFFSAAHVHCTQRAHCIKTCDGM